MSNTSVELISKKINNTDYILWDTLPYNIREYVFAINHYDESKMIKMKRECNCGYEYFYEEDVFFDYIKNFKV